MMTDQINTRAVQRHFLDTKPAELLLFNICYSAVYFLYGHHEKQQFIVTL